MMLSYFKSSLCHTVTQTVQGVSITTILNTNKNNFCTCISKYVLCTSFINLLLLPVGLVSMENLNHQLSSCGFALHRDLDKNYIFRVMYSGCFVQLEVRKCPCLSQKHIVLQVKIGPFFLSLHHRITWFFSMAVMWLCWTCWRE